MKQGCYKLSLVMLAPTLNSVRLLWKEVSDEKCWEKSDGMNNLHPDDKCLDNSHFATF